MKTVQNILRILPLIFALSFLLACSQQIQGRVFLDKNGNNVGDQGEVLVSGVPYTVTLNNSHYATGMTGTGGKYLVTLDNTNSDGTYCIKVDAPATAPQKSLGSKKQSTPKLLSDDASESESCTMDSDDSPDCNDENCCDEPECESASVCENDENDDTETEDSECPSDSNNQPICSDSRCANLSSCNTDKKTVKSMQACGELATTTLVMNLDVPISVDYSSRAERISHTLPTLANIGDLIEVDVTYPSSCVFDLYSLPAPFFPEGLKGFYNEVTREFSLDQAVTKNVSRVSQNDKAPFGHDPLNTYTLFLKIVAGPGTAETEYVFQPSLVCPDGQRVKASATTIKLAKDPEIFVKSEISPDCPAAGESATILSEISNPTSKPLSNVSFKISLAGSGNILTLTNYPNSCLNKGDALECEFDSIAAGENKSISMGFQLDDTVPAGSGIEFSPELTVDETQYSDAVITCNY